MKRFLSFMIAIILAISSGAAAFAAETTSASQITNPGGTTSNTTDKVSVSKTIEGTNIENVFDITLEVETQQNIETMYEDPDVALCIVMDISNTMMEDYGSNSTKYKAAIQSAETIIDEFASYTTGDRSKLGFVAFNTIGYQICKMQKCSTTNLATSFKNKVRSTNSNNGDGGPGTGWIVNQYDRRTTSGGGWTYHDPYYYRNYDYYHDNRYTNIEAGLKRANDMLKACTNKNKFVIFLSDGLPTTYCKTTNQNDGNYNGYVPLTALKTSKPSIANGTFWDNIAGNKKNKNGYFTGYICYGGNYSDKGAIRARNMAATLKSNGVTVYSVGAGLNSFSGTTLEKPAAWDTDEETHNLSGAKLIQNQMARAFYAGVSTIDNSFGTIDTYSASTINGYHWEICNYKGGTSDQYASLNASGLFENWLKYAIGSNQYYDTANTTQLKNQFKKIFEDLTKKVKEEASKAWIVTDPIGTNLEFIGFYNKSGTLVNGNLSGSLGANKENTATKASDSRSFNWELQKSGYISSGSGSSTTFTYTLKYRVRLTNEVTSGFVENTSYNTNGTTTLKYQTSTNGVISDMKTIDFNIPAVKGYLGELTFSKKDNYNRTVSGAVFTLTHDTANCSICKGNGTSVADTGNLAVKTATSNANGVVSFTSIPSGHKYTLVETTAPTGYTKDSTVYHVTVAYDVETDDLVNKTIINTLDPYQIKLKKIDGTTQQETVLSGAEFEVYFDAAFTTPATHPDGTPIAKVTTGADGMADLGILDFSKTYYLKETKAPTGYQMFEKPVEITINPAATNKVSAKYGTSTLVVEPESGQTLIYIVKVPNNTGVELPASGGSGTLLYTLSGLVLIFATVMMYGFRMRRRERRLKNSL